VGVGARARLTDALATRRLPGATPGRLTDSIRMSWVGEDLRAWSGAHLSPLHDKEVFMYPLTLP
jgi:hypothetical protein